MDASAEKMVDFAIVPIETLIACRYILIQVHSIIDSNISLHGALHSRDIDAINTYYSQAKELFQSKDTVWPLIVREQSRVYNNITRLIENATEWLERSAFSASFAKHSKNLKKYLKRQPDFSASKLSTSPDDAVWGRYLVVLEQRTLMQTYKKDFDRLKYFCIDGHDEMKNFENFLMLLAWAREEPLQRMFSREFRGAYLEHVPEIQDGPAPDHVSFTDTESVVDMLTPSTTRTTSPALTEFPADDSNKGDKSGSATNSTNMRAFVPPDTRIDKAFFILYISEDHKRTVKFKVNDACLEQIKKVYGKTASMDDAAEIAIKMAFQ